ncbi:MAG: glycosyltransferase [Rickettsiales bacterium]
MINSSAFPSLTVVVCVHNAAFYAETAIDSVLRHTPKPYELILVDDGSDAETKAMLEDYAAEYDHITLIRNEVAGGYTKAANLGLRASTSDYTILLNSDTIVSPKWAERIISCGESSTDIGIIGPLSNAATYQSVPDVFAETGHWKQNELPGAVTVAAYAEMIAKTSLHTYPRLPVANGFCFAVKRNVIDAIGYLDEENFPRGYGEENDYCLRAADAGLEIAIADDAYVYHAVSKSFGVGNREKYTQDAHFAIRRKHGDDRLAAIDNELRTGGALDEVRNRIREAQQAVLSKAAQSNQSPDLPAANTNLPILFLLPDCTAKSGGTQVIVETARGLAELGVPVKIAVKHIMREEYQTFFAGYESLFWYYTRKSELMTFAKDFKVAVATIFYSVPLLADILKKHSHVTPAYYVQDYEPYFLDGYPGLKKDAEASYTLIPGINIVAISPWVCEVLKKKHGVVAKKITGMIDQKIFFPDYTRAKQGIVTISAMIRPSTAWRGPEQTMKVLKALTAKYGEKISAVIFGCTEGELFEKDIDYDFPHTNYGILGRYDVANTLRNSDIFLDLSTFQAFGRTALEAMSCGTAVVAPREGGVHDFGIDSENILLIDTQNEIACIEAASRLIEDANLRHILGFNGIQKGLQYSMHGSAMEFLQWAVDINSGSAVTLAAQQLAG